VQLPLPPCTASRRSSSPVATPKNPVPECVGHHTLAGRSIPVGSINRFAPNHQYHSTPPIPSATPFGITVVPDGEVSPNHTHLEPHRVGLLSSERGSQSVCSLHDSERTDVLSKSDSPPHYLFFIKKTSPSTRSNRTLDGKKNHPSYTSPPKGRHATMGLVSPLAC